MPYGDSLVTYTTQDSLAAGVVFCALEQPDGSMLFGTNAGISRLKQGKITNIAPSQALFAQSVFFLALDSLGNLWTGSNNGVYALSIQDLNEVLDGRRTLLAVKKFDRSDGMTTSEVTGACMPVRINTCGELCIPTGKGLTIINPYNIKYNTLVPPVKIEQVRADQTLISNPTDNVSFPPSVQRFDFHYTALSFLAPEKVQFKVKLDGFDHDWIDMRNVREITYTTFHLRYTHFMSKPVTMMGCGTKLAQV